MDYNTINVYTKEKFTLMSKTRNKQFRFIRYNGMNYDDMEKFIKEISPNTMLWDEKTLHLGTLYSYSGRDAKFMGISEEHIRAVIASNPFIYDGSQFIPLGMDSEQACDYLKQGYNNKIFCYEDILVTYMFSETQNMFLLFDRNHPNGLTCSSLPDGKEWYIGSDDHIHALPYDFNTIYQNTLHIVDMRYKFDLRVEEVEKKKYEINIICHNRGEKNMFRPSWENYIRRKRLSTPCNSLAQLQDFCLTVYNILFEETKIETENRATLGTFKNHKFVVATGELRNYFAHGKSEYTTFKKDVIRNLFIDYLKKDVGPQSIDDYLIIQNGVLNDLISFLDEILDYMNSSITFIDIIQEDYFDNIYCGKVLLPQRYGKYKGLECCIKQYTKNTNRDSNDSYPFFASMPFYICMKYEGVIEIDEKGICHCKEYRLHNSLASNAGSIIEVSKIRPSRYNNNYIPYRGTVVSYVFINKIENSNIKIPQETVDEPIIDIIETDVVTGVEYKIEVDSNGRTHIDNVLVGRKKMCKLGDIIRIDKISRNPSPDKDLVKMYPYVAEHIEKLR